jgi:hypothetical protein
MDDHDFYDTCAIVALQELIRKNPHADSLKGADVENIRLEIAKSADDYAAKMVLTRRVRRGCTLTAPVPFPTPDRALTAKERDDKVLADLQRHVPIVDRYGKKAPESKDPNACQPAT